MLEKNEFNPEFEWVSSHLDAPGAQGQPVLLHGQPLCTGQFGYEIHPKIYPSGLVMLNPRWTTDSYAHFYAEYYDDLYRLDLKADYGKSGVIKHMQEVWERISKSLGDNKHTITTVLDAGSGPGYGMQWLKEQIPQASLFAIEASPDACLILENEVGAQIIDTDLDGDWSDKFQGYFDLIIMRHVVEHILTPVETLSKIRKALAPKGIMYIAVPDMMHPRTVLRDYNKWWEYWFRAVHPYYYSMNTLFATITCSNIYPMIWGENNEEVWCICSKNISKSHFSLLNSCYESQIDVVRELLR